MTSARVVEHRAQKICHWRVRPASHRTLHVCMLDSHCFDAVDLWCRLAHPQCMLVLPWVVCWPRQPTAQATRLSAASGTQSWRSLGSMAPARCASAPAGSTVVLSCRLLAVCWQPSTTRDGSQPFGATQPPRPGCMLACCGSQSAANSIPQHQCWALFVCKSQRMLSACAVVGRQCSYGPHSFVAISSPASASVVPTPLFAFNPAAPAFCSACFPIPTKDPRVQAHRP